MERSHLGGASTWLKNISVFTSHPSYRCHLQHLLGLTNREWHRPLSPRIFATRRGRYPFQLRRIARAIRAGSEVHRWVRHSSSWQKDALQYRILGGAVREQIPRFFSILGNPLVKLYYLYFTDFDTSPRRSRVPSTWVRYVDRLSWYILTTYHRWL